MEQRFGFKRWASSDGSTDRPQRILWYSPPEDLHSYYLLWFPKHFWLERGLGESHLMGAIDPLYQVWEAKMAMSIPFKMSPTNISQGTKQRNIISILSMRLQCCLRYFGRQTFYPMSVVIISLSSHGFKIIRKLIYIAGYKGFFTSKFICIYIYIYI